MATQVKFGTRRNAYEICIRPLKDRRDYEDVKVCVKSLVGVFEKDGDEGGVLDRSVSLSFSTENLAATTPGPLAHSSSLPDLVIHAADLQSHQEALRSASDPCHTSDTTIYDDVDSGIITNDEAGVGDDDGDSRHGNPPRHHDSIQSNSTSIFSIHSNAPSNHDSLLFEALKDMWERPRAHGRGGVDYTHLRHRVRLPRATHGRRIQDQVDEIFSNPGTPPPPPRESLVEQAHGGAHPPLGQGREKSRSYQDLTSLYESNLGYVSSGDELDSPKDEYQRLLLPQTESRPRVRFDDVVRSNEDDYHREPRKNLKVVFQSGEIKARLSSTKTLESSSLKAGGSSVVNSDHQADAKPCGADIVNIVLVENADKQWSVNRDGCHDTSQPVTTDTPTNENPWRSLLRKTNKGQRSKTTSGESKAGRNKPEPSYTNTPTLDTTRTERKEVGSSMHQGVHIHQYIHLYSHNAQYVYLLLFLPVLLFVWFPT